MKNRYTEMFERFAPVKSDEELLKAVLKRKAENNMSEKKFGRKAIIIPAAAIAVFAVTTVSVSAAYQWNQKQALEEVLNSNAEGAGDNGLDFTKLDLNKVSGKELTDEYDYDGFKVKLNGVAADEHTAFLFYDIVFDEDFDYTLEENEEWWFSFYPRADIQWIIEYRGPRGDLHPGEPDPSSTGTTKFLGMEGNVARMCNVFSLSGISLEGKTLNYQAYYLGKTSNAGTDNEKSETVVDIKEDNSVSVTIDFNTSAFTKSVKPDKTVTLSNGEVGKLTFVGVSPFMVSARIDWETPDADENGNTSEPVGTESGNAAAHDSEESITNYIIADENTSALDGNESWDVRAITTDELARTESGDDGVIATASDGGESITSSLLKETIKVTFKDGTVKGVTADVLLDDAGSSHTNGDNGKIIARSSSPWFVWDYPVDVEQIASVTVGDVTIDF